MAAVQTNYESRQGGLTEGQLVNTEHHNIVSLNCADAAGIGFGKAVFQGAGDDDATATPGTAFLGISIRDVTVEREEGGTADLYKQNETMGVAEDGVVAVTLMGTVTKGDEGSIDAGGLFGLAQATVLTGTKFTESGVSGDVVGLRVK